MPVSRISILLLVVGVISFPQVVAAQSDPQSNDQAVKAYQALLKSYEANRQDRQFVRPFLELAQKYPGTQPALDSLTWVSNDLNRVRMQTEQYYYSLLGMPTIKGSPSSFYMSVTIHR